MIHNDSQKRMDPLQPMREAGTKLTPNHSLPSLGRPGLRTQTAILPNPHQNVREALNLFSFSIFPNRLHHFAVTRRSSREEHFIKNT
jgi:hypothetical protein